MNGLRITIVPGLAVRSYVREAADELERRGYLVELLHPTAARGFPKKLRTYGVELAERLDRRGEPVALLVGLSVGTQAAALAAARSSQVRRLMLVSPMVDPALRTAPRLIGAWILRKQRGDPAFGDQLPDWQHAGVWRILAGCLSALHLPLEDVLPQFPGAVTIVQPEWNTLSSASFARGLAQQVGGRYVFMPEAAHSWPFNDPQRFADLVDELLVRRPTVGAVHGA